MKITHLVESQSVEYGGPAVSVPWLASACRDAGHEVNIISVDKISAENALIDDLNLLWIRSAPIGPISAKFSLELPKKIREFSPNILHLHNLWNYVSFSASNYCSKYDIPLVISPRSGLYSSSLQNGNLKKSIALALFQRRAISKATSIHVTSHDELEEVRRFGYRGPIAIIPNLLQANSFSPVIQTNREFVLLCMSRLHPRKNIDKIIDGFAEFCKNTQSQVRLNIVGPSDDEYLRTLRIRAENSGKGERIQFYPLASGKEKKLHFDKADAFILISEFENFGMSIAEALAAGLPVVCSTGTPWRDIEEFEAGYCVSPDPVSLSIALQKLVQDLSIDKLRCMKKARSYFEQKMNSAEIIEMYNIFYQWILDSRGLPDFVQPRQNEIWNINYKNEIGPQ